MMIGVPFEILAFVAEVEAERARYAEHGEYRDAEHKATGAVRLMEPEERYYVAPGGQHEEWLVNVAYGCSCAIGEHGALYGPGTSGLTDLFAD